ncbi:MAG: hypothetical protein AAF889_01230 [Cyanobacteria bacterium P01_D01_bin.73]
MGIEFYPATLCGDRDHGRQHPDSSMLRVEQDRPQNPLFLVLFLLSFGYFNALLVLDMSCLTIAAAV